MYFVVYENRQKHGSAIPDDGPVRVENVLIHEHPLLWIDRTTEAYRKNFLTYIHFWAEVDDEIARKCNAIHVEPRLDD